ncbi:hypothetical protein EYR38_002108 [Pleurotus pulmonarius]|nr:hypothetical protein EYR38_002108 [Pleurotus pulmonarius]
MLCLLKPLLSAHQEVLLSRLDQVEQSVQEDLEDLRTGFKIFFDEYRVEWEDPRVPREQGYSKPPVSNDTPCDEYIKTSLGPVNWASPRADSVSIADSNAGEREEEPCTPKPLHALRESSYALKMSPESPNRPRGLSHHILLPTPSSSSPLMGRERGHQLLPGLPRSPPDSSVTPPNGPQRSASEEDRPTSPKPSLGRTEASMSINRVHCSPVFPLPTPSSSSPLIGKGCPHQSSLGLPDSSVTPASEQPLNASERDQNVDSSLGLVNWKEKINPLPASPSAASVRIPNSNAGEHEEESLIYSPATSPKLPRRCPQPMASSSSPLIARTRRSPSDGSPPSEQQVIASEEGITGPISYSLTSLPRTPSLAPPASSPSTDRLFSRFLNNEAMMIPAPAQEEPPASLDPAAGPSTFLGHGCPTSVMPRPSTREQSVGSSEYDALATESLLFSGADEQSHGQSAIRDDEFPVEVMKGELQPLMMATVDPTHISTLSPLSSLSSLSPSPEPHHFAQTHFSAPVQSTQPKLILKLNANRRKSAAATRIRKRKPKDGNVANTSDMVAEPPTKRFKSSSSGAELDVSTLATIQTAAWPDKIEADNGFLRKVIQCDTESALSTLLTFCVPLTHSNPLFLPTTYLTFPWSLGVVERRPKKGKDSSICARHDCDRQHAESEYHVSRIIGRRNISADASGTSYRWLIKWSGYSVARSTWETDDAISDPELLIKRFYQAVKKEQGVEFDLAVKEPILLKEAVKVGWW